MALATTMNDLLKLILANINHIVHATPNTFRPKTATDEGKMNISNKTLMYIPEETTVDMESAMDVVPHTVDPAVYLIRPTMFRGPPLIATIATARYVPPIHILQQFDPVKSLGCRPQHIWFSSPAA
uniref:Uncharacterized protein n=1 Tax=Romanomermis culicivorax TaxID=13658 RepID=A0A915JDZ4_ROMCU